MPNTGCSRTSFVAGEDATFNDLPHFAGGIVPRRRVHAVELLRRPWPRAGDVARSAADERTSGEGSRRGGRNGSARTALATGKGDRENLLAKPEVTRRTRASTFVQPIKERLVREVDTAWRSRALLPPRWSRASRRRETSDVMSSGVLGRV